MKVIAGVLTLAAGVLMAAWVYFGGSSNLFPIAAGIVLYVADVAGRRHVSRESTGTLPPEAETTMEVRLRRPDDPE